MDEFYAAAYDTLNSLRTVADSIKYFVTDPEIGASLKNTIIRCDHISSDLSHITDQLQSSNLVELLNRIDHIAAMTEEIVQTNKPQLNDLLTNITKVSRQLRNLPSPPTVF